MVENVCSVVCVMWCWCVFAVRGWCSLLWLEEERDEFVLLHSKISLSCVLGNAKQKRMLNKWRMLK